MLAREDGFTLVELVVVLAVIAILSAAAITFHLGARERAGDAILLASQTGYCVRAAVAGRTWYMAGPDAAITRTACP